MARRPDASRTAGVPLLSRAVVVARLAVSVPAKINLHLEIVGRRRDGFHELRTLFQSIDLYDHLTAEGAPSGEIDLEVDPVGAVTRSEENLVVRAAQALAQETHTEEGARLVLSKKIPVGGGLGGGSADAAAALVILDQLWGCGLDDLRLHQLAAGLGSDVPFFLYGGLALGIGRGDEVVPLPDQEPMAVMVVVPDVQVSTAEAYAVLDAQLTSQRQEGNLYAFAVGLQGRFDWRLMINELEGAVVGGWPKVGEGLRMLRASHPIYASLSGSGAASFAVFDNQEAAQTAAAKLPAEWFVHVGSTLERRSARLAVRSASDGGRR